MWPPGFTSGPLIDFARETGRAGQLLHVEEARGFVRLVANLADAVASVVGRITPPAKLIPAQIMSKLSWHTHHTHAHTHAHTVLSQRRNTHIRTQIRTHIRTQTRTHFLPNTGTHMNTHSVCVPLYYPHPAGFLHVIWSHPSIFWMPCPHFGHRFTPAPISIACARGNMFGVNSRNYHPK